MNKLGYQVNWTDTRKYITFTTPEGYKCRNNKLYNENYSKEEMEKVLDKNKEVLNTIIQEYSSLNKKDLLSSNVFDNIIAINNLFSNPQLNNFHPNSLKRYKNLSKQAMKDYAIKKANSSSFDWEDEEEL